MYIHFDNIKYPISFSFFRQAFAYSIFFALAMFAFVIRHHGEKIPSCATLSSNLSPNLTDAPTDGSYTLTTPDMSGSAAFGNSSELDELLDGLADYPSE